MITRRNRHVLISGASFAGLATAFWMRDLGYNVTLVEVADGLKLGGTPVNIRGRTVDIVKRMGLFDQAFANRLRMEVEELKDADGVTVRSNYLQPESTSSEGLEFEIERDTLLGILFDAVRNDVELMFSNGITSLTGGDGDSDLTVTFMSGPARQFDLVFGCDGIHSAVRRLWFGAEEHFSHFLDAYGSTTIVDKLLVPENTTQIYNEPGKAVMLNAYNGKTDIVLMFSAAKEIPYDYRNEDQQRRIIAEQFSGMGWRTPELLHEVERSSTFYFDKLCQIRMPSWTRGRVALIGDAGYCASPTAGMGGSLAIDGAAALADAFAHGKGDVVLAFAEYNRSFRPFVDEVQAHAVSFGVDFLLPQTTEAIRMRNSQG